MTKTRRAGRRVIKCLVLFIWSYVTLSVTYGLLHLDFIQVHEAKHSGLLTVCLLISIYGTLKES